MDKYISLELAKKLAENWCELESEYWYNDIWEFKWIDEQKRLYPAFDILNEISVKYAKEFLPEEVLDDWTYSEIPQWEIITLLEKWKKQEAEEYIWSNCLFNPDNK